jgi:ATP-dependent DNA ligase
MGRPAVAIFSGILPGLVAKTYTETTHRETPFYIWVFRIVSVTNGDLTSTTHHAVKALLRAVLELSPTVANNEVSNREPYRVSDELADKSA